MTISFWLAGAGASQLFLGPLSDFRGRRFVLLGGGIVFLLATLGCFLTVQFEWMLLFRFLQGVAVSSLMVTGYASIHELFEEREVIRVLSWMGSAAVMAPMAGPLLGGWVISGGSWRTVFGFLCVLCLFPLVGLWFLMPETNRSLNRNTMRLDLLASTYLRLLKNQSFMLSGLSSGLLYTGVMIWLTACPFLMIDQLGVQKQLFGFTQIPVFGSYFLGAWLMRSFLDKVRIEILIHIGLWIIVLSSFGFLLGGYLLPMTLVSLIVPMAGYSLGVGLVSAPLNRITFLSTEEGKGSASAVFYLCMEGLGAIGSFIESKVYSGTQLSVASLMLVIAILAVSLNCARTKRLLNISI
jgi:DHA1 family multidrug/chloramphenicol efflux transport protein-like MFS transporter